MQGSEKFEEEYKRLNKQQKEAVGSIDGPVMVVAGPGTGKTQILALRIGNILNKTDTPPDGILCLTFTNSAVSAMKKRLNDYIGSTGSKVNVFTFHSFGMKIIEEFFSILEFDSAPILMDDIDSISLCDEILNNNDWDYLKPRSDAFRYFRDLKSLISILKRDRTSPENFLDEIKKDIKRLKEDDKSISTRGESKGQLKKEVLKKIESLEKTKEVVHFYELYEKVKKEKNIIDYDDVLEFLVKIVEESDEVRDIIRERYLYVLVDEHQDSSKVQNEFLQKVWADVEKPNIFVVGDDRQLIYGFSGASLSYFEEFKDVFGKAKLITLVDNYRSTQIILDSSHLLLQSKISNEKLISHRKESHPIRLIECDYSRDEIIACALDIKEKIKEGVDVNDCAILVPKNTQARSAVLVLRDMGLPVASGEMLRLFDQIETQSLLTVLKIILNPYDNVSLTQSLFDKLSGIEPLSAHKFIFENDINKFSLVDFLKEKKQSLFEDNDKVKIWFLKLGEWIKKSQELNVYSLIQLVGDEFLLDDVREHEDLVFRVEIIRTFLHLALLRVEKNPKLTLKDFIDFIERLESYDENISLAVFGGQEGVKVLTLHSSKGLEFDYVWIAHMDERSLGGGKHYGFTLPDSIEEKKEKKDEEVLKRQLYVAITRAKRFCTLSYSLHSYNGAEQELAHIVSDLPENIFNKQDSSATESFIMKNNTKAYVEQKSISKEHIKIKELTKLVAKEYEDKKISVSLLNNFFECPWKWYFRNLLRLPEPKSESLEFGNTVHSSIDKILKLKEKFSQKDVESIVKEEVEKRKFGDEKKQEKIYKEILNIISKWVFDRLPNIGKDYENEKGISVRDEKFPHLNIFGKLDLVEKLDSKNVRVTDFKTGSVRKKNDIEKLDDENRMSGYLRQLAMYSYLIKESSRGKINVGESRLEFLEAKNKEEKFYERVITNEEIKMLISDISDYDKLVKNGEWVLRPCNYNSYGKNTECEYCKMAEIYK
ncbi:MAG TPA: ATP-dependent DNA helicase [Candidatus Paceibacterota bacterium]|nr:ATP-dependent DNA helicase [Candidatus Paceibacterota bacterium]HPT18215.1 ATP-dependent DNA helicase [Candidatus Paceibacterota bacterium]